MANSITSHIPNFVTCCNLFSGCIASVMAFQGDYQSAILFIILGAVFDFFDGMLARLFNVSSPRQGIGFIGRRHHLWVCTVCHRLFAV